VEGVLARAKLHAEGLVDGQPEHAKRDIQGAKNDRRPGRANLVPVARRIAHHEQCDTGYDV
jgi:hypothetical protein